MFDLTIADPVNTQPETFKFALMTADFDLVMIADEADVPLAELFPLACIGRTSG